MHRFRPAGLGSLLCCLLLFSVAAGAAELRALHGHVPALAAGARRIGQPPPNQELTLALGLSLRNRAELTQLLNRLYDPASPQYRHFVTAKEFADSFGPTEADYASVRRFAEANGFRVIGTHPNRTLLDVKAPVRDIERAFHLRMALYEHPTERRTFYAPDREPSVEADVPLLSISGLENSVLARPAGLTVRPQGHDTPDGGSGPAGYYWGYDFRNAYAPGVTLDGFGPGGGAV